MSERRKDDDRASPAQGDEYAVDAAPSEPRFDPPPSAEPSDDFLLDAPAASELAREGEASSPYDTRLAEEPVSDSAIIAALADRVGAPRAAAVEPSGSSAPGAELSARYARGAIVAGKYRIEGKIARGGMGLVFLATQLPLGRKVAFKVVRQQPGDDAFRERFLLEASTCARLSHANIVVVYDYGETEHGDLFTVMEYLGRRSLAGVLRREESINPARACAIALQVARALRVAHRNGVVHRDLKPSNVMLIEDPEEGAGTDHVKVVDFGLVRRIIETEGEDRLTRAGMLLGSPRYMSPEQIRNRPVDPRSDIYSLGVITHQMLTGSVPFDGDSASDILAKQLRDPAPTLSSARPDLWMPTPLESLVMRCLAKRPADRFPHVDEVIAGLKHVLVALGGDLPTPSSPTSQLSSAPSISTGSLPMVPPPIPPASSAHEALDSGALPDEGASASGWWAAAVLLASLLGTLIFWALVLGPDL